MDGVSKNAFRMIAMGADAAFSPPGPGVASQSLLALSMIEDQCRVLRTIHGDGDGMESEDVEATG